MFRRRVAFLSLVLLLAACQSDGVENVLNPTAAPASPEQAATTTAAARTFGSGPVRIGVLLPLSATGVEGERARAALDAMALAATDLGGDVLTVSVRDTGGEQGRARKLATEEIGERAAILIGPSDIAGASEMSAIKGDKRPPFLLLAWSSGKARSTYSLPLHEADSAAAGIAAAAGEGRRAFALLVGDGPVAAEIEARATAAVLNNGGVVEAKARFGGSPGSIDAAVKAVSDAETRPDAILVASAGRPAAPLLKALAAAGFRSGVVIGTSGWAAEDLAAGEGAMLASVDRTEMAPMIERFRQTYGREPRLDEAFAYDAMALSAGLARTAGERAFAPDTLHSPSGFRSSTGVFRLMPDGSVQRLLALHRVAGGRLKRVGPAPQAF